MSHFTKIQTVIREEERLCQTLRELHYEFKQEENIKVRGYQDDTQSAQVVINTGCDNDIGFQRQSSGTFDAVADWDYGIKNQADARFHQDRFLAEVNQKYAHLAVREEVLQRGFIIEEERTLSNGEIELVVCEPV